jgi:hypothetical protein
VVEKPFLGCRAEWKGKKKGQGSVCVLGVVGFFFGGLL